MQNYRSIRDTGWFEVESNKTIMVGPNEAGKTAVLQALQQINPPPDVPNFDALRDYPRALYNDISTGRVKPSQVTVASARFTLEADDLALLPPGYEDAVYEYNRKLDNGAWHKIIGGPSAPRYDATLSKDLARMASHADKDFVGDDDSKRPSITLSAITINWEKNQIISAETAKQLENWLQEIIEYVDETNNAEDARHTRLVEVAAIPESQAAALKILSNRRPVFILFNNYFRVKPSLHLGHLATRIESNVLDDDQYDYGNQCLLKLLGFTARELSDLGKAAEPNTNNAAALQSYKDQLDKRSYQLNAASVRLTEEIRSVWNPNPKRAEADRLRISADKHENAILLLDEPGLSLHGLKQRDFRNTISRLAEKNQTLYTTHSPFLVGPDELDLVRVVEMADRTQGTIVHTSVTAEDPAALLPLQEALGYDLAQSLFTQQRNLVLEGLTDYWYLDATSQLLAAAGGVGLNDKIALLSAEGAGKVVYYAIILHANNLKVAALLDSDNAGDNAAHQETLVHRLGNKNILRTKDAYTGKVNKPEVEDLLREILIQVAKDDLGWDVSQVATQQPARPIVDIFTSEIKVFSKYKLAKAYLRWTRTHEASDLSQNVQDQWGKLIVLINKALK